MKAEIKTIKGQRNVWKGEKGVCWISSQLCLLFFVMNELYIVPFVSFFPLG